MILLTYPLRHEANNIFFKKKKIFQLQLTLDIILKSCHFYIITDNVYPNQSVLTLYIINPRSINRRHPSRTGFAT